MLKEVDLKFPQEKLYLKDKINFNKFLEPLYEKTWITYIEPPKGKAENTLRELRWTLKVFTSDIL